MPHLLAADLAATSNPGLRSMAYEAAWYLLSQGDIRTGLDLANDLRHYWRQQLGYDNEDTLAAAHVLAWVCQDILDRTRKLLGDDHPDTLYSARKLAYYTALEEADA